MIKFVKILAIVMILAIVLSVAACSKKPKCGYCGKTKEAISKKIRIDGEEVKVCDSCYSLYKLFEGTTD